MTWLYVYLGVGALFSVAAVVLKWRRGPEPASALREFLESRNPVKRTWVDRLIDDVLAPAVALLGLALLWPIVVYEWTRKRLRPPEPEPRSFELKEFTVLPEYLQQQLTREQIEASAQVDDPLGAVPALPFGHLNAAWLRFVAQLEDGEQLWSFHAHWEDFWGMQVRSGYAAVRDGQPQRWFLTVYHPLEDKA